MKTYFFFLVKKSFKKCGCFLNQNFAIDFAFSAFSKKIANFYKNIVKLLVNYFIWRSFLNSESLLLFHISCFRSFVKTLKLASNQSSNKTSFTVKD